MKQYFFFIAILIVSCSKSDTIPEVVQEDNFFRAADISFLPEIETTNTVFYNAINQPENVISILKNSGCNAIRIRLWKNPSSGHSNLSEVKTLANRVKQAGMKVWLTVHFSDTWADPGAQIKPLEWQNLSFVDLKIAVSNYTSLILSEVQPDIFQIGNETNDGFIYPDGRLSINENQFLQLVQKVSTTIRSESPTTKIMLHYAGIDSGANYFFDKVRGIDYDYIGLSYYPIWHGKMLSSVTNTINTLGQLHNKKVIIAETSYPFTLSYNDFTNNVVCNMNQLIPSFPPTPQGQKEFMFALKAAIKASPHGMGFGYWGTEWVAYRGNTATNGSSYENQAMWDFNNKALPILEVFRR